MKKVLLGLTMIMAVASISLTSCGGSETSHEGHDHGDQAHEDYECPMKCEGDKHYHEAGNCPVCKMEMKAI